MAFFWHHIYHDYMTPMSKRIKEKNYIKLEQKSPDLIENNIEKNKGIRKLIIEKRDKIIIQKDLLKGVHGFIGCIG